MKSVYCPVCGGAIADSDIPDEWGVTLRDYFAGIALLGYMRLETNEPNMPFWCYGIADNMIGAREK